MPRYVISFPLFIVLAIFLAVTPLDCQAEEDPELEGLVDELRFLAEKSRNERAADRWLQQALEDLISKYDRPWRRELLFDDFSDGNFTADPEWRVISGRFWIDASLGLRSRVQPKRRARQEEPAGESSAGSRRDLGGAIFEAILDSALKKDDSGESRSRPEKDVSREGPARIRLEAGITNAFLLELAFSVHNEPGLVGHFEVSLLQEQAEGYGYLLAIHTGGEGMMDLYRLRRGQKELVNSSKLKADTGRGELHELVWRQADNGQIEVFMNGEEAMSLRDKAFRDGYRWLELVNQSGELGVRRVKVLGTPQ